MAFRLRRTLGLSSDRFVFIGLANDYADYCASPDEYMAQECVGASTLWGRTKARSSDARSGPPVGRCAAAGTFRPEDEGPPRGEPPSASGTPSSARAETHPTRSSRKILRDRDDLPARKLPGRRGMLTLDEKGHARDVPVDHSTSSKNPAAAWEARTTSDGTLDDSGGFDLVTMLMDPGSRKETRPRRWAAIWIAPILEEPAPDGRFLIRIAGDGAPRCSAPFVVSHGTSPSPFHDTATPEKCPAGLLPRSAGSETSSIPGGEP